MLCSFKHHLLPALAAFRLLPSAALVLQREKD